MDILDILLARKKSFTGETEKLTRQANEAMAKANEVASILQTAENTNTAAQEALTAAQNANQEAQDTLSIIQEAAIEAVTDTTITDANTSTAKVKKINIKKDGVSNSYNIEKNYTSTGQNEDGAMTQKAITNALSEQKLSLENKIKNIEITGGGSGNVIGDFEDAEPGSLVVVDDNGGITASTMTEEDIIKTQIILGTYNVKNAIGLEIDYNNRTYNRIQEAAGLVAGSNFDKFKMLGGRRRCIVNDDGEIVKFQGESGYIEDGSIGQVMVYQPKFYYFKLALDTTKENSREKINKEFILLSYTKQAGFSIHPLFLDKDGQELEYVFLSAYEGCAFDTSENTYLLRDEQIVDFNADKLSSIAGAKPISGTSQQFTVDNAEKMGKNRGEGWQLTNLAAESASQMLMTVEYGNLNLQNYFDKGITTLNSYNNTNASCLTGSTSTLGAQSGRASSTIQTHGNTNEIFTEEGKCAISYRGFENPYGNIWRFVGGVRIIPDGNRNSGIFVYTDNQNQQHSFASALPSSSSWISRFGYDQNATWAFIPTECNGGNSAVPVGDYTYIIPHLQQENCCVIGGKQNIGEYAGPFYYGMDYPSSTAVYSYSGRIMYIPTANTDIYFANIAKWNTEVGGD